MRCVILVLVCTMSFGFVRTVFAASLTSINDQMADQSDGALSNHEISFTTPTGAAEGATITVTFASNFDTSSVTEDDVDVEVGGTDRTTAASCAGTEHASVAIASDAVTITICAGDGGAIAASAAVVVKIGTNATGSGTGSNRITNPTSVGSYGISITGTFGDTGSITVPIVDASSGSVTATVPSTSSGSGGGGGGSSPSEGDTDTDTGSDTTDTGTDTETDTTDTEETSDDTTDDAADTGDSDADTDTGSSDDGSSADSSEGSTGDASEGGASGGTSTESGGSSGTGATESGTTTDTSTTTSESDAASESGGSSTSEEEIVPESGSGLSEEDISYLVENGEVALEEDDDIVSVLPDRTLTILIPESALESEAESVTVTIDGETYALSAEDGSYGTVVVTPETTGEYQSVITITYADGSVQVISTMLDVESLGYVYERTDGDRERVGGARVTLYESQFGEWVEVEAATTAEDGTFGWYVENGIYRIGVTQDGYQESLSDAFSVSNHIATATLEIEPLPEPIGEIMASDLSVGEKAVAILGSAVESVDMFFDEIRTVPEVQTAADIAAPVVVTLTVTSGIILWNVFNLAPLLQYLFTSPLLLIGRRKRKAWGVVYNAVTKLPVDLAVVRLLKMPEQRLVMTRVTDKLGRYFFLTQPGEYRIVVVKPGHAFPSQILEGAKEDGKFLDVYHGESIAVTERDATIAANLPMDPGEGAPAAQPRKIRLSKMFRRLQRTASVLGIVAALFVLLIQPGWLTVAGFVVQIVLFGLFRRLSRTRKPKNWGIVYDEKTKHPLANAIVRIFEPKYNKLLETAVTDRHGRYSFLVGPNEYFVTYERDAYHPLEVRPIDLRAESEAKEIAPDIGLQKLRDRGESEV